MTMNQYPDLLERILGDGLEKHIRNGTSTVSDFGHEIRFQLSDGLIARASALICEAVAYPTCPRGLR